uniref:enoyl-[acyl-carrier-protein] reductase n=1 Tax=Spongospora subterranea TaxID=70186 RepID=A0A0H5QQ22_9EUKA|eukprot:CRZ04143.1 hypothetical protein [Spongospora subterranea]
MMRRVEKGFGAATRYYRAAVYRTHGKAEGVVRIEDVQEHDYDDLQPGQALIKFIASPINPSDINQIEGTYAILHDLPATPGNEGVALVERVHDVDHGRLKPGQRVIPASPGLGTWRTHCKTTIDNLIVIPDDISVESAATLAVNPVTAYRLLHDFMVLDEGSTIIQNAANSAVGRAVIQICKLMKVKTVNIIRDRDDFDAVSQLLTDLGADYVLPESDFSQLKSLPKPVLALNAVGGPSCTNLARSLCNGGQIITYGGMSRKPVTLPTGLLIFNDIVARGFWLTRCNMVAEKKEKTDILERLTGMIRDGMLKVDTESYSFEDLGSAISRACTGKKRAKVLLRFD